MEGGRRAAEVGRGGGRGGRAVPHTSFLKAVVMSERAKLVRRV